MIFSNPVANPTTSGAMGPHSPWRIFLPLRSAQPPGHQAGRLSF